MQRFQKEQTLMAAFGYRVACLTGSGTAPELMAEATRALETAARLHGVRVEQIHAPVGADARVRHGHAVSHAARAAFLRADAVLIADDDDAALAELARDLDLRARQTRVLSAAAPTRCSCRRSTRTRRRGPFGARSRSPAPGGCG